MLLALAMCPCRKESRREKELGVCRAVRWRLWLEVCLHRAMLVPLVWPMKTWDLAFVPSMVLMFSASSVLLLHLLSFCIFCPSSPPAGLEMESMRLSTHPVTAAIPAGHGALPDRPYPCRRLCPRTRGRDAAIPAPHDPLEALQQERG